jgi:hypothetical protein
MTVVALFDAKPHKIVCVSRPRALDVPVTMALIGSILRALFSNDKRAYAREERPDEHC